MWSMLTQEKNPCTQGKSVWGIDNRQQAFSETARTPNFVAPSKSFSLPNDLSSAQIASMAPPNACSDPNPIPADDEYAGPQHGKQNFPRIFTRFVNGLTLNQVPLLQSSTSHSSTANPQPNRCFSLLPCSPSPLPPGPKKPMRLDRLLQSAKMAYHPT